MEHIKKKGVLYIARQVEILSQQNKCLLLYLSQSDDFLDFHLWNKTLHFLESDSVVHAVCEHQMMGGQKQTEIALGNVCEVLPDGSQ